MTAPTRAWAAWERFWFAPEPTSTLALVRIAFALVAFGWTASLAPDLMAFYTADGIHPELGEQPTGAWTLLQLSDSPAAVWSLWAAMLVGSLCLLVGFVSRAAALVVFVGLVSFTRRDFLVVNSGDELLRIVALFLALSPCGAALSVDRWLRVRDRDRFWEAPLHAPWALRLIQVQLSFVYLSTVWHKVRGETWNDGTAVSYAFRIEDISRFPLPDALTGSLLFANLATFGTLAVELGLAVLVWNRVLRPWILLAGVGLHLGIDFTVRVGFFTPTILVCYLAFLPPARAAAVVAAVRARLAGRRWPRLLPLRPGVR